MNNAEFETIEQYKRHLEQQLYSLVYRYNMNFEELYKAAKKSQMCTENQLLMFEICDHLINVEDPTIMANLKQYYSTSCAIKKSEQNDEDIAWEDKVMLQQYKQLTKLD